MKQERNEEQGSEMLEEIRGTYDPALIIIVDMVAEEGDGGVGAHGIHVGGDMPQELVPGLLRGLAHSMDQKIYFERRVN